MIVSSPSSFSHLWTNFMFFSCVCFIFCFMGNPCFVHVFSIFFYGNLVSTCDIRKPSLGWSEGTPMGCRTPRPAGHARGDLRSSASRRNGWCGASRPAEAGDSAWVKSGVNDAKICQIYHSHPWYSQYFPVIMEKIMVIMDINGWIPSLTGPLGTGTLFDKDSELRVRGSFWI